MQAGQRKYCDDENINNGFCNVNYCPLNDFKCYYMQCFTRCPNFTVRYNNSCVVKCFDDKPFILKGKCVSHCPKGYVIENGVCQMTCSNGRFLFNETCVDKCPKSREYVDENQCVSDCPTQKLYENTLCVNNCSEQFVLYGRSCKIECSSGLFKYNRMCVNKCPDDTLQENQNCVENCSSDFFQYASNCLATCPLDHFIDKSNNTCVNKCEGFKYYHKNNVFCLNDCPDKTAKVQVNLTCVSNCPNTQPFLYDRSCFAKCPVASKFFELKREPGNIITYTCVDKCKKYTSSISNMCVDACSSGKVLFRETCQEQCPESDPFKVHLPVSLQQEPDLTLIMNLTRPVNAFVICAEDCPSNFVRDNDECYLECPNDNKSKIFNMTCFQQCPEEYPYVTKEKNRNICTNHCERFRFQQECLDKCPDTYTSIYRGECVHCSQIGMYEENQQCVNSCKVFQFESRCYDKCPSEANFAYNGTCVRTCPLNASKIDEQKYDIYTLFVCMDSCPTDKLIFKNHCVSSCPNSDTAIYKRECVLCSQLGMYKNNQHCVNRCKVVQFENTCLNNCPPDVKFAHNGSCVQICPLNASKVDEQQHDVGSLLLCTEKCPTNKFTFENNCVFSCPQSKSLPLNGICTACQEVGKFDDGSKCVDKCRHLHHDYRCVDYCPYRFKIYNNSCVRNCPLVAPLLGLISNNYTHRNEEGCVANCREGEFLEENKCVSWCFSRHFIYNNTCVEKCPTGAPFITDKNLNYYIRNYDCLKQCKDTHYSLNFTCFEKCPHGFYGHKKQCIKKCPEDFPYINHEHTCVENCQTLHQGMNCYDTCPQGTYQFGETCVHNCHSSKPYNYNSKCVDVCPHFLIQNTCYEQCPYGLVGYQRKCLIKCPTEAKYRYKWECFVQCPNNTILNLQKYSCFDSCPNGKFKYQQFCYDQCPLQAPYYVKGECVDFCDGYLKGSKCLEHCPHFYDNNFNCIKECPKNSYPHGKFCKTDCPQSLPFTALFPSINNRCVEKCNNYELATENYKCILSSQCSGVIYDDTWCFQACPSQTYIKRTDGKNLCISLIPVYLMICILSLIVFINIAFGIKVWWHYYNPEQVRVFSFFVCNCLHRFMCITSFLNNIHVFCAKENKYFFSYNFRSMFLIQ